MNILRFLRRLITTKRKTADLTDRERLARACTRGAGAAEFDECLDGLKRDGLDHLRKQVKP